MIGVGNVGETLTPIADGDTFMTRDGGLTWKEVHKGSYFWEYGDQGSIIVIVSRSPTNDIRYTLNEGATWETYKFADEPMPIFDLTTAPSDTSRKFVLWGKPTGQGAKLATIQLDFTGLTDTRCMIYP